MLIEVKVPQLSESVSEATLITWNKKKGDTVTRDENLIDIETDKVVLETPAPADGVLVEIIKQDGESVTSGDVLAKLDTEGKGQAGDGGSDKASEKSEKSEEAADKKDEQSQSSGTESSDKEKQQARDQDEDDDKAETKFAPQDSVRSEDEWRKPEPRGERSPESSSTASPAARKILDEKGLSAADVLGTGRDGRVTKEDAVAARSPGAEPEKAPERNSSKQVETYEVKDPTGTDRPEDRVPMTRLRARIAERLLQSKNENAILTTFNEVNMKPVVDMRKQYGERFEKQHGVRLGFMGFFVKAVVAALKRYPILNASVDGSDIVYHGYIDIGIAVGTPRGLVVPIIRDADQLSVAEIENKIRDFGKRAQDGKLGIEELTGGTFSITNGGVFGSMLSTPIINPPQAAILGIHATKDRPVVENGEIVIRPINYLAMSYDHRIIDGREAVLGLVAIKEALEDPARLILDV